MKQRILEVSYLSQLVSHETLDSLLHSKLEDELAAQPPPAKRARKSAVAEAAPQASGSGSNAPTKKDEKKHKAQIKKIFDRYVP